MPDHEELRMRFRTPLAGVAAAVMALGLVAADGPDDDDFEDARPPADYIAMDDAGELSQPDYPETITETMHVASWDGTDIYVEVTRPDPEVYGEMDLPVVMEASPYHGTIADRDGTRIFPDPVDDEGNKVGLTGFFAPRGYAVAIVDLRGTGRSGGCLDHLGPNDGKDLKHIVEWAASQEWSNGKVGMTGHSYVGSTPKVAAAMRPEGLATIVPSAGLASMYDHQFQSGVPYLLQYIGPMVAYESLALARHLPEGTSVPVLGYPGGDDFGNHVTETGCGMKNSAAISGTGQVTGEYQQWHAERDWRDGAADADIPVFMVHGVNDNAARIPAAEWFFGDRFDRENDKVWIGQWDHGSTNGRCGDEDNARTLHPTCRFDQFQEALHAWFDKHLKGMDVDTGPAVEAFLNGAAATALDQVVDPATEAWGTQVFTADSWSRDATRVEVYPDATTGTLLLGEQPTEVGTATFGNTANGVLAHVGTGSVTFTSEPVEEDTVIVGLPKMQLDVSVTSGQVIHLVAELNRVDDLGRKQPMTTCAIQPQLRFGVETLAPVIPLEEMTMTPTCFTMAHFVPAGQRLELEIDTVSPHHASFGGTDRQVTVFTGPGRTGFLLPVQEDATVFPDVPLRRS